MAISERVRRKQVSRDPPNHHRALRLRRGAASRSRKTAIAGAIKARCFERRHIPVFGT